MWTYSPQKRQVGSAFALTYRLLLRSCKLMGAFIFHPRLPFWWSLCTSVGPLRSTVVTPFLRYCCSRPSPSRLPPISWFRQLYAFPLLRLLHWPRADPPVAYRVLSCFPQLLASH